MRAAIEHAAASGEPVAFVARSVGRDRRATSSPSSRSPGRSSGARAREPRRLRPGRRAQRPDGAGQGAGPVGRDRPPGPRPRPPALRDPRRPDPLRERAPLPGPGRPRRGRSACPTRARSRGSSPRSRRPPAGPGCSWPWTCPSCRWPCSPGWSSWPTASTPWFPSRPAAPSRCAPSTARRACGRSGRGWRAGDLRMTGFWPDVRVRRSSPAELAAFGEPVAPVREPQLAR